MDTRLLDSLVAVIEKGSLTEAAQHLNLTPTAIAQRIQALEKDIGARLIQRSGRTVRPTPAGSELAERSRGILQDIRALRSIVTEGVPVGELRLGAIATAMTGLLPALLTRCNAEFPGIDVHVTPGTSRDLYPRVLEGDLDAAFIVQPDFVLPKSCAWSTLRVEPMIVIAPATAPQDEPHHLLSTQPFIRYDRSNWGGRLADIYLRRAGIQPRERFELDSLDAIAVMVDQGLGVSLVPDWAPPWPTGLSLRKYELPDTDLRRSLGVVWLRTSPRSRHVAAFLG